MIDFKAELKKQMRFVRGSSELYDAGNSDEAIRIANSLEIIFNGEGRYKKLPDWLSGQDIKMVSTRTAGIEKAEYSISNMIKLELNPLAGIMRFHPCLQHAETRIVSLIDWWQSEVIFRAKDSTITRKDLVLWARNTDGGAHIQKKHSSYDWLFSGAGWSMSVSPTGQKQRTFTAKNAHLATLRQMAFEVLNTPMIKAQWHPDWHPTHRLTATPSGKHDVSMSWEVMQYGSFAYSRDQWEQFLEPVWEVTRDGRFELIGESPCEGSIEIKSLPQEK